MMMRPDELGLCVKRQKAVEWLLINDPLIVKAAKEMRESPCAAIMIAAAMGDKIRERVEAIAEAFAVSSDERRFGYPLLNSDLERRQVEILDLVTFGDAKSAVT